MKNTFRSLGTYNYRIWAAGALVSNVGTWMQRIAQDWLVLSELTKHSGTAVGVVMALQFGPPILLMSLAGWVVDHVDRRKLLIVTQSAMALTALGLGILDISGHVALWQVYVFAGTMGCIAAFDSPARQTFVAELVGDADLPNAVALNSTLFNSAQLIGPAVGGVLISIIGAGWVFILNSVSFVAVITSLMRMRVGEFHRTPRVVVPGGGVFAGLAYIRQRPELIMALVMLFIVGTYGLNFPVFISTMSITTFHGGAHLYGILSSMMAVGSVLGALHVAGKTAPNLSFLTLSALGFGIVGTVAALMPAAALFGLFLVALGVTTQMFTTTANSLVQLSTDPSMRGRVMAIYMGIFLGCTPLGAPLVGWIADAYGPRWSLGVGAAAGFIAAGIGGIYQIRARKIAERLPK
ncbi:MAG: MFS transporter [Burkholderiaceae bacterium]|nr:MFS transporter [Burkholderiaceae bacterium]